MNRPTFGEKVRGDRFVFGLSISIGIIMVLATAFTITDGEMINSSFILYGVVAVELLVVILRARWINSVFDYGVVVRGTGKNSNLTVEYMFQAEHYKKRIMMNSWSLRRFKVDQPLDLVVDEAKPRRVLIKEMFIKD